MLELRPRFRLAILLQVAGLARSTFYYQTGVQQTADKYVTIKVQIRQIYASHHGLYGYRRVTLALRQAGTLINHKTVRRLMRALGLQSCVRRARYHAYRGPGHPSTRNLLQRQFHAGQPHEKWVTDVTEFKVREDKLYLSPVLDLYNGEVIAYALADNPRFTLVDTMLRLALQRLGPQERPLLHSDQGWQYQMPAYRRRLAERGLTQSMSRRGNCLDNAAMESFFGTLKAECFHLGHFDSIEQLRGSIHRYIHYYNHDRIKLKLGMSPVQFRRLAMNQ